MLFLDVTINLSCGSHALTETLMAVQRAGMGGSKEHLGSRLD